jgi:L-cysteine desulfidase
MDNNSIIELLKKELVVAMGCTEPACAALVGNKLTELLGGPPSCVTVSASRDMVKNAMGVGIPNCEERGLLAAVCLGVFSKNPVKDLSILSIVTTEQKLEATRLAKTSKLNLVTDVPSLYIRAAAELNGHRASCAISQKHTLFTELMLDERSLLPETSPFLTRAEISNDDANLLQILELDDILKFAHGVDKKDVDFVLDAAKTNFKLAEYSVQHRCGLGVAYAALADLPRPPKNLGEAFTCAAAYASAASDARMSGSPQPVVINSGSGNQGITCTVPIFVLAKFLKSSEESLIKALVISELVGLMITARKDRLSALCGVFTAAMGAGCGMVFLLDGGLHEMNLVIRSMVANLSGIVCDGAKTSCALKVYSTVQSACLSVRMAINNCAPDRSCGIVGNNAQESIQNLMLMCHEGMIETDKVVMSIMLDKQL